MPNVSTIDRKISTIKTTSGIDVVAGLWLLISPLFFSYDGITSAVWNAVIVGIIITILAAMRLSGDRYKNASYSWINAILGIWVILSPYIFGYSGSTASLWNSIIVGIIVLILAVWGALSTPDNTTE